MRIAIIGLGVAGVTTAKLIRDKDKTCSISIFTDEPRLYYSRPKLIDYLAGTIKKEELFVYDEAWYKKNDIDVYLNKKNTGINPYQNKITLDPPLDSATQNGATFSYDKLVIANGSTSFVPPIKGSALQGVFTLYSLDDADKIISYSENNKSACVIGGGLLGLETARALHARGLSVNVIEVFPRLLPRQLDRGGAGLLKKQIEKFGIGVVLDAVVDGVVGADKAEGVFLKDGRIFNCDMVVISAGTRPNLSAVAGSGIAVNKGIIVDKYLRTSPQNIYALGDVAEFGGRCYGIIPAALEQAKVLTENILKEGSAVYEGTIPSNALKVIGIDLVSIGEVNPEGQGFEEVIESDEPSGTYKKLVIRDGKLIGAILLGDKTKANEIMEAIKGGKEVPRPERPHV